MAYIQIVVDSTADGLKQDALDVLTANGWAPQDGDPEVVIIEALTPAAQNAAEVAAEVPPAVFRKFGTDLFGVPYLAGAQAEADATIGLVDDGAAHTIPAGTAVKASDTVYFATTDDVAVAAHATSATGVLFRAVDEGAAGDGFTGVLPLVNPIAWVNTVTFTTTSSGGEDAESDDTYQDRLRSEIQAAGPPVTDVDFAIKAIDTPSVGIGRATAQTTAARTVTVAVTDIAGNALSTNDKNAIAAYLDSKREVNFVVTVQDADYNYIAIAYQIHSATGFVDATVEADVAAALRAFVNPATWGQVPATDPASPANSWSNTTKLYLSVVTSVIQNTAGVDHVGTVTIMGSAADYTLTGTAPLPTVPADATVTGNTHSSTTIDTIASTAALHPKMAISGSGIPAGATIATVSTNSITISSAATATATGVSLAATALVPTVI